jgi:hypothetical protein
MCKTNGSVDSGLYSNNSTATDLIDRTEAPGLAQFAPRMTPRPPLEQRLPLSQPVTVRPDVVRPTSVFVSHAIADTALAAEVHRWLVDGGHEAFLDQDLADGLLVGEEWERRLRERLRWADAMVCVLLGLYRVGVVHRRADHRPVSGQPAATGAS